MPVVRALFRVLGWLLTPLVAWVTSFIGAGIGAWLAGGFDNPMTAFWVTVGCGAATALVGAWGWLHFLRKSPKLQETLAVAPDGTPLIALEGEPPESTP